MSKQAAVDLSAQDTEGLDAALLDPKLEDENGADGAVVENTTATPTAEAGIDMSGPDVEDPEEELMEKPIGEMSKNELQKFMKGSGKRLDLKKKIDVLRAEVYDWVEKQSPEAMEAEATGAMHGVNVGDMQSGELVKLISSVVRQELKAMGIQKKTLPAQQVKRSTHLRNPKNGRVTTWTRLLAERGDMVACDEKGRTV